MSTHCINQTLLPSDTYSTHFSVRQLSIDHAGVASQLILGLAPRVIGLELRLSSDGDVESVVFSTPSLVVVVNIDSRGPTPRRPKQPNVDLQRLLSGTAVPLAGFCMHRSALHIYRSLGCHVSGVDLSTLLSPSTFSPWLPSIFASRQLDHNVNSRAVDGLWNNDDDKNLYKRAWLSAVCANNCVPAIESSLKVNTRILRQDEVQCLAGLMHNVELLDRQKPRFRANDFVNVTRQGDQLVIHNARYKTKVRYSAQTEVVFETSDGLKAVGRTAGAEGRTTTVTMKKGVPCGQISRVHVVGREEFTNAERSREEFVLRVLRGELNLVTSPFIRILWFPGDGVLDRLDCRKHEGEEDEFPQLSSNLSQSEVAQAMTCETCPMVVAHGPPGTGKTTTISAVVQYWSQVDTYVWVVAQSNVGVKNIAEKFFKDKIDFKIVVSKEFYYEWHEHLYETFKASLIRADELVVDRVTADRLIGGSQVILCTMGMLSNPGLDQCDIFRTVPMTNLVIDEASQIDTLEFMHLFHKFSDSLEKVCFFGDPKQLPPYGQESAPNMKSIFEIAHLKKFAYFLDTQYRMPVEIGDFISGEVYDSKLYSNHPDDSLNCLAFIDVWKGEETKQGSSWVNTEEVNTVVNLVKNYYQHKEFCVITPYDAQRGAIAKQLKAENLQWETVFNVDAFQGHEAPFVIISPVRTSGPGFLTSINRMNVMLTRCKTGMIIVSQQHFLSGRAGSRILLGKLMRHWEERTEMDTIWQDAMTVANKTAKLPGFLSTDPPPTAPAPLAPAITYLAPVAPPPSRIHGSQSDVITPEVSHQDVFPSLSQNSTNNEKTVQGSWRIRSELVKNTGRQQPRNTLDSTSVQTLLSQMRLSDSSRLSSPLRVSPKTPKDEAFPALETDNISQWRLRKNYSSVWTSKK